MNILRRIKNWFNRKDLRELCVQEYGEEFGEKYDKINMGMTIGYLCETIDFIDKVENVKKKYPNWK